MVCIWAYLSGAYLTGADLFEANLTGAMLLDTVIIKCISSKAIVDTHTDFFNAIIDNPDFLKHLREKGCQNIPNEINNKQELRKELLKKRNIDPNMLDIYLSSSELPES
jgi:Pentapeptide repeats (8 copies)